MIKSGSNTIHESTEKISNHLLRSKKSTFSISDALNELSVSVEEMSSTIQNIKDGVKNVLSSSNVIAEDVKSNSINGMLMRFSNKSDDLRNISTSMAEGLQEITFV